MYRTALRNEPDKTARHRGTKRHTPPLQAGTHLHASMHARATEVISVESEGPGTGRREWRGDNKLRDHESYFGLLSSDGSPRQEESPDGNRRQEAGVRRHLLPP